MVEGQRINESTEKDGHGGLVLSSKLHTYMFTILD